MLPASSKDGLTFVPTHPQAADAVRPAAVGLATLRSQMETPVERILAAALLFSGPPVVFYLAMQRYIVSGLTAGAVKG